MVSAYTPASEGASIILVRHGETTWSRSGKHTSTTEVGLTEVGEQQARDVGRALAGLDVGTVLSSPRRRARETAALAGFDEPEIDDRLTEWDYGALEGETTDEISERIGHAWSVWSATAPDPVPGETAEAVGARADGVIQRLHTAIDDGKCVLVFSHAHFLRILASRWLGLPATEGRRLALGTATLSELGFEHGVPVVARWNMQP